MFDVALESFDRRVRLGADDPFTRYYAAAIHALRGDAEPALAFLERALVAAARLHRGARPHRARVRPACATTRDSSGCSRPEEPLTGMAFSNRLY